MPGNNILVTEETFLYRRDSGKIRIGHIRMTELTLDLFDPDMHIMAEGDRLLRTDPHDRQGVEIIEKRPYQKHGQQCQSNQ